MDTPLAFRGSGTALEVATVLLGSVLVGVALRLLRVRQVPVADLLAALILTPALTAHVDAVRG